MGSRDVTAPERAAEAMMATRVAPGRVGLACVLAWLVPGAGHWYLGRRTRGTVFFALITLSFGLGGLFHGRFSVVDARQPFLSGLQVIACLGSGPMEIVARTRLYRGPVYKLPEEDASDLGETRRPRTLVGKTLRSRTEAFDSSYGTAYLWTAGLMNLLLILDAFDIGRGRKE